MKTFSCLLLALIIVSCGEIPEINPSQGNKAENKYILSTDLASVIIPIGLKITKIDLGIAAATNPSYKKDESTDWRIAIEDFGESTCVTEELGSSKAQFKRRSATTVFEGKVDYFDIYPGGDFPRIFRERVINEARAPVCKSPVGGSAYILCSEKDGKRVVVCIQQMTDNPELAEEIFSTFQWTK